MLRTEQWWTDVRQVCNKSSLYELNQRAAVTLHTDSRRLADVQHAVKMVADLSDAEPDVALDIASESEQNVAELLEHANQHGGWKRARIPPCVWDVCKKSHTCYRCGGHGHRAKECNALRVVSRSRFQSCVEVGPQFQL